MSVSLPCRFVPYVGIVTILMNDYPNIKVRNSSLNSSACKVSFPGWFQYCSSPIATSNHNRQMLKTAKTEHHPSGSPDPMFTGPENSFTHTQIWYNWLLL